MLVLTHKKCNFTLQSGEEDGCWNYYLQSYSCSQEAILFLYPLAMTLCWTMQTLDLSALER